MICSFCHGVGKIYNMFKEITECSRCAGRGHVCTDLDCDNGLINLGQSFVECECKEYKPIKEQPIKQVEEIVLPSYYQTIHENANKFKKEFAGMETVLTGEFFMDSASKPSAWSTEEVTIKDFKDQINKLFNVSPSAREKFLEEENKRLKVRLGRQRKELKRLNKQIKYSKLSKQNGSQKFKKIIEEYSSFPIPFFPFSLANKIDMKGAPCNKYGCAGTYQETNLMDDTNGLLHCNWCNKEVSRWVAE